MPYKSKAQAAAFHAKEAKGEIPHETVKEWDAATKRKKGGFAKLPEHVHKTPIDEHYRHEAHGKDGSHQGSEKALGGKRKIVTGSPEEQ